jgi:hypothetical protein
VASQLSSKVIGTEVQHRNILKNKHIDKHIDSFINQNSKSCVTRNVKSRIFFRCFQYRTERSKEETRILIK